MILYNSKDYFSQMREVKKQLMNDFDLMLSILNNRYPILAKDFNYLYDNRIRSKSLLLRPFVTKTIFELLSSKDWGKHSRLIALVEIINISTYQSNLAFDNKDGIKDQLSKFNQLISAFFSTFMFIDETIFSIYDDNIKIRIIQIASKRLQELYYGQYIDLNILKLSDIKSLSMSTEYEKIYLERCRYLGSSLIGLCVQFSLILSDCEDENLQNDLLKFSEIFGIAGQIINDLGDLTSKGRVYTNNRFSDIDNGRLTLPIMLMLKENFHLSNLELKNLCNDKKVMLLLIEKIKKYLVPYISEINQILENVKKKGYDITNIRLISNLLTTSKYLEYK